MSVNQIKVRRDTAANWAAINTVLASGEFGLDTTNDVLKIGDGITPFLSLAQVGKEPTIATQEEAEAGTANDTFMTPLRTSEAINELSQATAVVEGEKIVQLYTNSTDDQAYATQNVLLTNTNRLFYAGRGREPFEFTPTPDPKDNENSQWDPNTTNTTVKNMLELIPENMELGKFGDLATLYDNNEQILSIYVTAGSFFNIWFLFITTNGKAYIYDGIFEDVTGLIPYLTDEKIIKADGNVFLTNLNRIFLYTQTSTEHSISLLTYPALNSGDFVKDVFASKGGGYNALYTEKGTVFAITDQGRVFAKGFGIGDGTSTNYESFQEITSSGDFNNLASNDKIVFISGAYRSVVYDIVNLRDSSNFLAISQEGRVFTWGNNWGSQIGDGTTTERLSPVEITYSGHLSRLTSNDKIIGGDIKTHGIVYTQTNRIFSWGVNTFGQLGDDTTTNKSTPVEITRSGDIFNNREKIISANVSSHTSLILKDNNKIFVFGDGGEPNPYKGGGGADGSQLFEIFPQPVIEPYEVTNLIKIRLGVE